MSIRSKLMSSTMAPTRGFVDEPTPRQSGRVNRPWGFVDVADQKARMVVIAPGQSEQVRRAVNTMAYLQGPTAVVLVLGAPLFFMLVAVLQWGFGWALFVAIAAAALMFSALELYTWKLRAAAPDQAWVSLSGDGGVRRLDELLCTTLRARPREEAPTQESVLRDLWQVCVSHPAPLRADEVADQMQLLFDNNGTRKLLSPHELRLGDIVNLGGHWYRLNAVQRDAPELSTTQIRLQLIDAGSIVTSVVDTHEHLHVQRPNFVQPTASPAEREVTP